MGQTEMGRAEKDRSEMDQADVASGRERPLARRSVAEVVADHIRQQVFYGELRDGERVPQREIAQALGVSSVPVREALAALQREGVVTNEPNRGAFVNGLDAEVVTEQFYIFGRVYGLATRVVAQRGEPAVVSRLVSLARRIEEEDDLDELLALSIAFQMEIAEHGGSKRLRALFTPLSRMVPGNFYETIEGSSEITKRGVSEMAAAIAAGKAKAAEQACWKLIDQIGELVAGRFRGGFAAARTAG